VTPRRLRIARERAPQLALAALCAALSASSAAGPGGFATEITQIANNLQLVQQYAQMLRSYIRQGEELQQSILDYAESVRNSNPLAGQLFGPIEGELQALANIVQQGRALAYSMANLDEEFRTRFTGQGYRGITYLEEYAEWSQTSLDTTLSALRAVGLQASQLENEQTVLQGLRELAVTADGRMQAIQVTNQIAEQNVQQLMKLRQLMMADISAKAAWQAEQTQRDMANTAAARRFFDYAPPNVDGEAFWGGSR
jgi:P-type conjugative transfer protein TrbJ